MRNIYNLISKAFDRMGLNEMNYTKKISETYIIEIVDPRTPLFKATLYIDLDENNTVYDVTYTNNLFEGAAWDRFCSVFIDEMPPLPFE